MKANFTLKLNHMLKKTIILCVMTGAVALAVASSGGGNKKKSDLPHKPTAFTPIRTTNGFTLKAGPVYSGSSILSSERSANSLTYNTVVTYQRGSSVIILPHQSRVTTSTVNPTLKSNLNFLDLKIRLRLHK